MNLRRGERAREIEVLRQHYRKHRDFVERLAADAPTEHLAAEYQRIGRSIDVSLQKLDELEGRGHSPAAGAAAAAAPVAAAPRHPARTTSADDPNATLIQPDTQPAMRPLQPHPALRHLDEDAEAVHPDYTAQEGSRGARTAIMIALGVIVLTAIAWLIWRSADRPDAPVPLTDTETVAPAEPDTGTIEPAAPPSNVAVTPESHNYGLIRKGTRATRQFEIANTTDQPLTVQVARSACRCLFYEYVDTIAPRGKEALTVTVDATRAKVGELRETIKVSSKKDPTQSATFDVVATIQ